MSEARDRLIFATYTISGYSPNDFLDLWLARPADLIAVVIETLTCETCGGCGWMRKTGCRDLHGDNRTRTPHDHVEVSCPDCNGSTLDPVKVQAVLRQFADAGALTEEFMTGVPGRVGVQTRLVGPWVPLGAPE